ncbi:uncharacterized protein LOC110973441 [Acanthaster planci]|uniref:Uncharacterized protein LOC110973441 n=1 Tax=Acanthaster planci TaxID=133434 RepID=A0A8B7XIN4_ACAPL|nr:uncharacterized protein LOC110973441 [Acanthaster planci]
MEKTAIGALPGLVVVASVITLFAQPTRSQGTDLTTIPESFGVAVVEATVRRINRLDGINRDLRADYRFIRRIAWVETTDGTDQFTYSDQNYHGGIWRVDRSVYDFTMTMYNNPRYASLFSDVEALMQINWSRTTWQDCRKPLYSALAARLYFHSIQPNIPQGITLQATLWRTRYHDQPSDTVGDFIAKVEDLESEGCSVNQIDLVFVLDSSGSVGQSNFEKTKSFVSNVSESFQIGADQTRVAVIQYSSSVKVEFHLNTYADKTFLQEAIRNITYIGGGTATVSALNVTESQAFLVENGARPDLNSITRAAVVITDGRSQGPAAVAVPADRAREKGITIFAIGVTDNVNVEELNAIANKPNDTYVFHVSNFDAIDNIVASLEDKTCNDPTPIRGPVVMNTLVQGDTQYLQQAVSNEGVTLVIEADQGNVAMYISTTTPNPNKAFYDYLLKATAGQGKVEVYIGPEEFVNQGNLSIETGGGGDRMRRQAPGQNDTDDGSPIGTVYMTIEGLQETNNFVLRVTEGDVTEPVTTSITMTRNMATTKESGTKAAAYLAVGLTALFTTQLLKSESFKLNTPEADDLSVLRHSLSKNDGMQINNGLKLICAMYVPLYNEYCTQEQEKNQRATVPCGSLQANNAKFFFLALLSIVRKQEVREARFTFSKGLSQRYFSPLSLPSLALVIVLNLSALGFCRRQACVVLQLHTDSILEMERKAIGVLPTAILLVAFLPPIRGVGIDLTVVANKFNTTVVEATITKLNRLAEVNEDLRANNRFLRRIAWVETEDGTAAHTYSDPTYHGGIWRVDEAVFDATTRMVNELVHLSIFDDIERLFCIRWSRASWEDCRKPLYSALAARLFFHNLNNVIPLALEAQADNWFREYHALPTVTAETFILKVTTLEQTGCNARGLDLLFVLDGSGSVGSVDFNTTKNFVLTMIDFFDIGPDKTRVGVIQYSTLPHIEFHLKDNTEKAQLKRAAGNITYRAGWTHTGAALNVMSNTSFLLENGARPPSRGFPRVAVVVTDGKSQDNVTEPAERARDMGIVIFAIGVTSSVKGLELNAIANEPNDTYVYHVNDFDAIVNIAAALEYTTCDQPTELQNGTANGFLDRNEKQNFQYAYTSKGLTLSLNGSQGCTVAYISASTPNPNAASYDFILMAKEGQGTVTLHLTVDDLNKNCTSEFARERREMAPEK